MISSLRWMVAVGCVALLAFPAVAQNTGGLPGLEHELALKAFRQAERVLVYGNVVHYKFDVVVGPGEFDSIRLHRVVKETGPYRPVKKMEGVLLLPGAPLSFESIFLQPASPSASAPSEEGSIALFLASNDIDVWGMDYGWGSVPYGTTDFSSLKGWGVEKDAQHAEIALSIARWMRVTSGQGIGPIHLLGYSYGPMVVYAVAGEDAQRPGNLRNVKGIITVDGNVIKTDDQTTKDKACQALPAIMANIEAGVYAVDASAGKTRWRAALEFPNVLSPLSGSYIPPYFPAFPAYTFTNYEAALVNAVRNKTYGGMYTTNPPSVSFFYTFWERAAVNSLESPYYTPYQFNYDGNASLCESIACPVAFDDHLGEITVPIFHIARPANALYQTQLTGSNDISSLIVNPSLDPSLYGHADFFLADSAQNPADNAANKIWRPILNWILAHR